MHTTSSHTPSYTFHATTIICVRRGERVALGGDGQVTLGSIVIKGTARKIRRLYHDKVLAGFAGAAQAQSTSVTLYGFLDVGLAYSKVKFDTPDLVTARTANNPRPTRGNSFTRVGMGNGIQSGSRWGLRGSEDLGDGLRAIFNVESGFTVSDGQSAQGGRLFGRTASLGLASDAWGTLEFGRQLNMSSRYLGDLDPFGRGFGQANIGHAISAANTVWYDSMMLYRTPNFNGFEAGIGYSFSENDNGQEGTIQNFVFRAG